MAASAARLRRRNTRLRKSSWSRNSRPSIGCTTFPEHSVTLTIAKQGDLTVPSWHREAATRPPYVPSSYKVLPFHDPHRQYQQVQQPSNSLYRGVRRFEPRRKDRPCRSQRGGKDDIEIGRAHV